MFGQQSRLNLNFFRDFFGKGIFLKCFGTGFYWIVLGLEEIRSETSRLRIWFTNPLRTIVTNKWYTFGIREMVSIYKPFRSDSIPIPRCQIP